MPDAVFEGQEGKWITTKTGRHIFIPNNKSVKDVLADVFEDFDWEDDPEEHYDRQSQFNKYYDFFVPEIEDEAERNHKLKVEKSFKGILDAPYAYIKQGFKKCLMKHPVYDMPMEDCIANMLMARDQVRYMYLQDIYTKNDTYYNRFRRRLQMKYDGDFYSTLSNFYHESGHALDAEPGTDSGYSSYTRKDNRYGKSISELLLEEITDDKLPYITEQIQRFRQENDDLYSKWKSGDISRDEYRAHNRPRYNIASSLGDVIHASLGFDKAMEATGEFGHSKGYYDNYPSSVRYAHEGDVRRGTEFFAEMVDSLCTDKNRSFANIMEHIAPKSCEIFYKIMEERYGYKRK